MLLQDVKQQQVTSRWAVDHLDLGFWNGFWGVKKRPLRLNLGQQRSTSEKEWDAFLVVNSHSCSSSLSFLLPQPPLPPSLCLTEDALAPQMLPIYNRRSTVSKVGISSPFGENKPEKILLRERVFNFFDRNRTWRCCWVRLFQHLLFWLDLDRF